MSKIRTFVAIDLPKDVRKQAAQLADSLRSTADSMRWVEPANMHWTLQFLGDVEDVETPEVCRRVAQAVASFSPFRLSARGAGAFPSLDKPRTLWLGAGEGAEEIIALQQAVESSLASMGFRGENRRFVPHLTLGRLLRGQRVSPEVGEALAKFSEYDAGVMEVSEVVIFSSELTSDGPTYQVMGRAPLLDLNE